LVTFPNNSPIGQQFYDRYTELTDEQYEAVYVRLRGVPGQEGEYGLGGYQREFKVREVVDMRPWSEDDCS
jgi:hypothetical protein